MHLKLISCEIFYREVTAAVARSLNVIEIEFLSQELHGTGCDNMRRCVQEAIDRTDGSRHQAILLGYGLCNNAIAGLQARSLPVVVPRTHDCAGLLLGSEGRYLNYAESHPGACFCSTGWIERSQALNQPNGVHAPQGHGTNGNGAHGANGNSHHPHHHHARSRLAFIETGIEPDDRFERQAREEATRRGLQFEKLRGDLSMIQRFVDGFWNWKEFLVVPAGWQVSPNGDPMLIAAQEVAG